MFSGSSKETKLKKIREKLRTKFKKSSSNQSQVFRDFASTLSLQQLAQLFEEYRTNYFMKELSLHAESARPIASTIRNDLNELYDLKYNTDLTLVYKGVDFPVHKAIICVRCPFFRESLSKKAQGSVVSINLEIQDLRVELFNDLLKYLYSGELAGSYDPRSNSASYEALIRISQQCGVPNPLAHDLKHLLDTGIYSDASLCFQQSTLSDQDLASEAIGDNSSSTNRCDCFEQTEFSCHQAILSARSPFFRNVIARQLKRHASLKKNSVFQQKMKIILDESIIPRRLAKILLHVMYRDSENLLNLLQTSLCKCRSNSKEPNNQDLVKELMNLYEIARFLEIDYLVQSCEDMIINQMNLETLILILKWSEQPHGSPWIKRQALTFMKEEFSNIISSPMIMKNLEYNHLNEALRSNYLEASELDILKSIIKWAENHLQKKFEDREPNLLSSHSLTRKTLKKKEIDDLALRETIAELIDLVRIGHILPANSEYLQSIAKRGLVQLPIQMLEQSTSNATSPSESINSAWFRKSPNFVKPRMYSVYFDECKALFEERIQRNISLDDNIENYLMKSFSNPMDSPIPDNLYMIDRANLAESILSEDDLLNPMLRFQFCLTSSSSSSAVCYEDSDRITQPSNLPVLEERILLLMRQREQELRTSPFCIRALQISHGRCEALRLIQLRVVREFGLPDIACEMLHLKHAAINHSNKRQTNLRNGHHHQSSNHSMAYHDDNSTQFSFNLEKNPTSFDQTTLIPPPPPRPLVTKNSLSNHSNCDPFSYDTELRLEEVSQYELDTQFSSTDSSTHHRSVNDSIPAIANVIEQEI
ncbi:BTB/POZ domain-containing protein 7 [Sarcoptes scabiei]|uniref:BTB/POZ domain-containing protein 7 n=1 Tax=Sarcoptes scabiei TaxID=52283 RepID=A0A132AM10_SARSC|nr:BTB/POZ domain-containing protein 7 [Sarcoptes scabiei]